MARRNMDQIIERTKVPERYDLTFSELCKLVYEPTPETAYDAFKYGFALGMRYQKTKGGKR